MLILLASLSIGQTDAAETNRVLQRFRETRHIRLMEGASWSLAHQYGDIENVGKVFKTVGEYHEAFEKYEAGDQAPLIALGGIKGFKTKLSTMLKDADPAVRCYAATLTGITGDKAMVPQVAALLLRKAGSNQDHCGPERAMVALALMGASQYKLRIATELKSTDSNKRSAAIRALALLGATEYAPRIAAILSEPTNTHDVTPIEFLVETGMASSYKPALVKAMMPEAYASDRATSAMYALAIIGAREHAKDIATFLANEYRNDDAAKALALMGADEYSDNVALLLKDKSPLTRCTAALSIGILGSKRHVDEVAKLLNDPESYVQPYAALALVMLGAEAHYAEALPHLTNREAVTGYLIGSQFPAMAKTKVDAIAQRALAALDAAAAKTIAKPGA